jgi:hypothetical protein
MKRMVVALGILGLVCAIAWPTAANAAAPVQMKLFGTMYNVTIFGRDQTYKKADGKQAKIVLQPSTDSAGNMYDQKSSLYFAEGADPSKDRLLIAAHLSADNDTDTWHNLYMLTGAGADGLFSPADTTLTEFFGGVGDRMSGGRPLACMIINDVDTGVKKDRNVLLLQWTGDNGYRLYDWDSMIAPYESNELYFRPTGSLGSTTETQYANVVPDPNAPWGDEQAYAPLPTDDGHTILGVGVSQNGGTDAGIWDTKTDAYFPVHTDLSAETANDPMPIPSDHSPHAFAHYAGNEYWLLASDTVPNGNPVTVSSQQLFRVQFTLPADPSKGKEGDIKVKVLGMEELVGTPLQTNDGMNYGMAAGREVPAGSGKRQLYFCTLDGKIAVLTPVP